MTPAPHRGPASVRRHDGRSVRRRDFSLAGFTVVVLGNFSSLVDWESICMKNLLGKIMFWLMGVEHPPGGNDLQWQLSGDWEWTRSLVFFLCAFTVLSGIYLASFYFRERSRAKPIARLFLASLRLALIVLVVCVLIFQLSTGCPWP